MMNDISKPIEIIDARNQRETLGIIEIEEMKQKAFNTKPRQLMWWGQLLQNYSFTEEALNKYYDEINHHMKYMEAGANYNALELYICHQILSEKWVLSHKNLIKKEKMWFSTHQDMSEKFIEENIDLFSIDRLNVYYLSEEFIKRHIKEIDILQLVNSRQLSENFIMYLNENDFFIDKILWTTYDIENERRKFCKAITKNQKISADFCKLRNK